MSRFVFASASVSASASSSRAVSGRPVRGHGGWRRVAARAPALAALILASLLGGIGGLGRLGGLVRPAAAGEVPARPTVLYRPPVFAPITDPFRPPSTPYGPGNRGIEYATIPGTAVAAAADGRVTFAGPVAGSLFVTLLHADGIRTSYGYLAAVTVASGRFVRRGEVVGVTGPRLHVGARRGSVYLDPASLWGAGRRTVLVALDGAGGPAVDGVGEAPPAPPAAIAPSRPPGSPDSPGRPRGVVAA